MLHHKQNELEKTATFFYPGSPPQPSIRQKYATPVAIAKEQKINGSAKNFHIKPNTNQKPQQIQKQTPQLRQIQRQAVLQPLQAKPDSPGDRASTGKGEHQMIGSLRNTQSQNKLIKNMSNNKEANQIQSKFLNMGIQKQTQQVQKQMADSIVINNNSQEMNLTLGFNKNTRDQFVLPKIDKVEINYQDPVQKEKIMESIMRKSKTAQEERDRFQKTMKIGFEQSMSNNSSSTKKCVPFLQRRPQAKMISRIFSSKSDNIDIM